MVSVVLMYFLTVTTKLVTQLSAIFPYMKLHKILDNLYWSWKEWLPFLLSHEGCDTVYFLAGHSKKTAWKVLLTVNGLLTGLGQGDLSPDTVAAAERFICRVYGLNDVCSADRAWVLFFQVQDLRTCFLQHLMHWDFISREHITKPWFGCTFPYLSLQDVTEFGWIKVSGTSPNISPTSSRYLHENYYMFL